MAAKSLDDVIASVNKEAKETIFSKGLSEYTYVRVPFTSPRMNYMTYGGLALGRLVEFFGEEGGGKTTTALDVVANFQNMFPDRKVLYVDAENTLDPDWARKIGVDLDNLYLLQPKTQSAEEIFQIILDSTDTGEVGLWILDSIGVLLSAQELAKELDEATYGGISKPLTRFGKAAAGLVAKNNCLGIAINQLRDDMNSSWGGTTTPGGRGWRHYCSNRIQFSKGKYFDDKGNDMS